VRADSNITSHDQITNCRRHQALLHRRHQEWLWKTNSSLLQKKRSGATRSRRQTFVDAVLRAAIHRPAKNVKRLTSDDRSKFDDEYRLAALTALRTWCESDVTSEPVACCPAAQRLVDNGGAMEVALVAIASFDPFSLAATRSSGFGVRDTFPIPPKSATVS
jgi:hypothetical protein